MKNKLNIKLIVGSTREGRFSEKLIPWIKEQVSQNKDIDLEVLDLRDYPMSFFNSAGSPAYGGGDYDNPVVAKWSSKISKADGFIIIAPEYNHGYTAVLKNALDQLYKEWNDKSVGFVSYGSAGGARAVEQLRQVAVELHMIPVRDAVHILPFSVIMDVAQTEEGEVSAKLAGFDPSFQAMLGQVVKYASALKKS